MKDFFQKEYDTFAPLMDKAGVTSRIDEIAILRRLPMREGIASFKEFNRDSDTIFLNGGEVYRAQYIYHESDLSTSRIEQMVVQGKSPELHHKFEAGEALHASFKVPTFKEYHELLIRLEELGHYAVDHFVTSYGLFSYFKVDGINTFLKPRVKLRVG